MTPQEAIAWAEAIPEEESGGYRPYDELHAVQDLLQALENHASKQAKAAALAEMLERAEAFRHSEAPGHLVWYHSHLRAAAMAAKRWGGGGR